MANRNYVHFDFSLNTQMITILPVFFSRQRFQEFNVATFDACTGWKIHVPGWALFSSFIEIVRIYSKLKKRYD